MTSDSKPLDTEAFGQTFQTFLEKMSEAAPSRENAFIERLRTHFGGPPASLPVLTEDYRVPDHPNVQLAMNSYLAEEGRSHELLGVVSENAYSGPSLSAILAPRSLGMGVAEGPVEYTTISTGRETLSCVQSGLYLIRDGETPLAVLMCGPMQTGMRQPVRVEVLGPTRETGERFLSDIRRRTRRHNVYRGQVISLGVDDWHQLRVQFHHLPVVAREDIVLPKGLLERIERQTIGFSEKSKALVAAGRHLKRGILLHGPPGTGKTFTAMHLAHRMTGRTILLLTGRGMGLIEHSCAMARLLEPATVILEDVDLVAEERTHQHGGCSPLLFELLNQMDGLDGDADVLFILTTNRPDLLEPALAARPGRIDLAVEVPLPDEDCRRRLFEKYGRGLDLDVGDFSDFVRRSEGVSAAFIRELLRKAALYAADGDGAIRVRRHHLEDAMRELVFEGGALTRKILGAAPGAAG